MFNVAIKVNSEMNPNEMNIVRMDIIYAIDYKDFSFK